MANPRTASKMIMETALARTVKPASFIRGNLRSLTSLFQSVQRRHSLHTLIRKYLGMKVEGSVAVRMEEGKNHCC